MPLIDEINLFPHYPFGFICWICNDDIVFCIICGNRLCNCLKEEWTNYDDVPICNDCTEESLKG